MFSGWLLMTDDGHVAPLMAKRKGKKTKRQRRRRATDVSGGTPTWMDEDGLHALLPGTPPDQ